MPVETDALSPPLAAAVPFADFTDRRFNAGLPPSTTTTAPVN
ncbi:hypothetical protein ACIRYZ_27220 [Kitasatospora sp. NPDC101155]